MAYRENDTPDTRKRPVIGWEAVKRRFQCGYRAILFFDDTSGLDYGHMLEVSRRLRELAEQGLCVVVITHDGEFLRESGAWTADWLPNDKQP